jgi:hypothetical protein
MMKIIKSGLVAAAVLGFIGAGFSSSSYAETTNFSHTTLGIDIGRVTPKTPICAGGQCLSSLSGASVGGSIQFADDLLIASLSGDSVSGSTSAWSVKSGGGALTLAIVKAIGDKVDIQAGIASLSSTVEVCSGGFCSTIDDTGLGFGGALDVWLDDSKKLAGQISMESSKYSKDTSRINTLGLKLGYYVTKNSEIYGTYGTNSDASSLVFGYRHHF